MKTDKFSVHIMFKGFNNGEHLEALHGLTKTPVATQYEHLGSSFHPKNRLVVRRKEKKIFKFAKTVSSYFIVKKCHLFNLTRPLVLHSLCAGTNSIVTCKRAAFRTKQQNLYCFCSMGTPSWHSGRREQERHLKTKAPPCSSPQIRFIFFFFPFFPYSASSIK